MWELENDGVEREEKHRRDKRKKRMRKIQVVEESIMVKNGNIMKDEWFQESTWEEKKE